MREENCIMELRVLIDRYGEKIILKQLAELVGQQKIEKAKVDFFLKQALINFEAPRLIM
ncbi:MAG: hypothetical protein J7L25_07980 [Deltaproteobacteria bacterium]|nr:hypothetical protein [Candidatus Tharpella aukensis]